MSSGIETFLQNSDLESMDATLAAVSYRTNKYLLDYQNSGSLHFAVDGGELYISVASGAYIGKVTLTQIK